jgi:cytochrome c553
LYKAILFYLVIVIIGECKELSIKPEQGPMTLGENFKLAKEYPSPSAWLLANSCSGCHGTDGAEMDNSIPPIVGLDKKSFISIMKSYKDKKPSKSTVMTIVAEPLTDKEIELMADYFSKQKVKEWTKKDWNKDVKAPSWAKGKR